MTSDSERPWLRIPESVEQELRERGWDGATVVDPDEQLTLDGAPEPDPDADLDELFGPSLRSPDENRVGAWHQPTAGAPETERLAAIAVYPRSGTARRRVLDLIAERGERGATAEECALALDMRHYTAAPRLTELKNDGWVAQRGTRETSTGADAAVFVLTDAGRTQHPRLP